MRHLCVIATVLLVASNAAADDKSEEDQKTCLYTASINYTKAKLALMMRGGIAAGMSIEDTIAQRRLQEVYCLQYARCMTTGLKGSPELLNLATGASFSTCLRDESAEEKDDH